VHVDDDDDAGLTAVGRLGELRGGKTVFWSRPERVLSDWSSGGSEADRP
jgi:hypothetical protein